MKHGHNFWGPPLTQQGVAPPASPGQTPPTSLPSAPETKSGGVLPTCSWAPPAQHLGHLLRPVRASSPGSGSLRPPAESPPLRPEPGGSDLLVSLAGPHWKSCLGPCVKYIATHHHKKSRSILSKCTVLCWAAFTVILGPWVGHPSLDNRQRPLHPHTPKPSGASGGSFPVPSVFGALGRLGAPVLWPPAQWFQAALGRPVCPGSGQSSPGYSGVPELGPQGWLSADTGP